jgi:hypothetical protein
MDFLKNGRQADPSSLLLLWQIGVMGDPLYKSTGYDLAPLPHLIERLSQIYGSDHTVILYIAPIDWGGEPIVERVPLCRLADARLLARSTLCIPPRHATKPDMGVCGPVKAPRANSNDS